MNITYSENIPDLDTYYDLRKSVDMKKELQSLYLKLFCSYNGRTYE